MAREDAIALAAMWEERRARLMLLIEEIRSSLLGASVEFRLRGIERVVRSLDRELSA
jgi:hypothetical protein